MNLSSIRTNSVNKPENKSLFISAGDPSGDIAGFHFLRCFVAENPEVEVFGLGGERMSQAGQEQFVSGDKLAALGFWEVAKKYRFFRKLFDKALAEIDRRQPSVALLIDYPGFNLRLAHKLKERGIPVVYYISPQVWAWGARRIPHMRELIDRLLVILPFEVEFFAAHNISAEYVGHYLLDDIAPDILNAPYNPQSRTIALLPGSRQQEVDRMLPTMLHVARKLETDGWDIRICGRSAGLDYTNVLSEFADMRDKLVIDKTRETVASAALVVSSSGTATLETALIGRPLIVLYKTGALTYQIARRLVKLKNIALANIVAGETVAPEFIQHEATTKNIVTQAHELLNSENKRLMIVDRFLSVRRKMRLADGVSPSETVAQTIADYYPS